MDMMPGGLMPAARSDDALDDAGGAVEICIKVDPSGAISVYQDAGDGQGESSAQSAPDIGQALKIALGMYRALGARIGGAEQFDAGFGAEPGGSARRQTRWA